MDLETDPDADLDGMEPSEEASRLARQFYANCILEELAGCRVRLTEEVEREEFIAPEGSLGTVQKPFLYEGKLVAAVKLDDPPEGSEDYEGEIHWVEDENLMDFEAQIELA